MGQNKSKSEDITHNPKNNSKGSPKVIPIDQLKILPVKFRFSIQMHLTKENNENKYIEK